jgi:hypothetical protein
VVEKNSSKTSNLRCKDAKADLINPSVESEYDPKSVDGKDEDEGGGRSIKYREAPQVKSGLELVEVRLREMKRDGREREYVGVFGDEERWRRRCQKLGGGSCQSAKGETSGRQVQVWRGGKRHEILGLNLTPEITASD